MLVEPAQTYSADDMGWLCMEDEVPGWADTPRHWQPHSFSSAEQPGGSTQLNSKVIVEFD
jgi:hypothetical protein